MSNFNLQGRGVFGRYCKIEMYRYGAPNEFYIHKCIGQCKSLRYCDVPLRGGGPNHEVTSHKPNEGEFPDCLEDVILVVTCGIDETHVFPVALKDVELLGEDFNDEWRAVAEARGQTIDRQAREIAELEAKAARLGSIVCPCYGSGGLDKCVVYEHRDEVTKRLDEEQFEAIADMGVRAMRSELGRKVRP